MPAQRTVHDILAEPSRDWVPKPPATADTIAFLRASAPIEFPSEYIELLQHCNGGFGELDAPPLLFGLDPIADAVENNQSDFYKTEFGDFWFFGGNGGLDRIAFDLRQGPPWRIVMIDPIAGPDSAQVIATSMSEFVTKIGRRHDAGA